MTAEMEGTAPATVDGIIRGHKILIVDDHPELLALLQELFVRQGAEVIAAVNGQEGLCQFWEQRPDLVILDAIMPVMDGWQVCARIRDFSDVPIIMLSAMGAEDDIVRGLASGAVDYVAKPFSTRVLLARAEAALRWKAPPGAAKPRADLDDGYLHIDLGDQRVFAGGRPVKLTDTEFRLLACLVRNADQVLTCEQILEKVWGHEYRDSEEYVNTYVWRLRHKLERDPKRPQYLVTERGTGYRFALPAGPRGAGRGRLEGGGR